MSSQIPELVQNAASWRGRLLWTNGMNGLRLKKHVKHVLLQLGKTSKLLKQLEDRCGCLILTSMWVKKPSHSVPTLCTPMEGRLSSAGG